MFCGFSILLDIRFFAGLKDDNFSQLYELSIGVERVNHLKICSETFGNL